MKAIGLVSGGLDGILAVKLIEAQGIKVVPLYFYFPFLRKDNCRAAGSVIIDISEDFIRLLEKPKYGFGANMNPCIDCRILMLRKARESMDEFGASFVITGEVLGQRPMSQNKQALADIERDSGLEGLLLRPLSAKLLPETIPEKNGWIDRDKLSDLNGRGRGRQLELAGKFGITDYFSVGGGCLLTESLFVRKLKDLIKFGRLDTDNIELLKLGRHFRISDRTKLIVGRDERENERLSVMAREGDYLFMTVDVAGPVGLARGVLNEDTIGICAGIICHYSDINGSTDIRITYVESGGQKEYTLNVLPIDDGSLEKLRI